MGDLTEAERQGWQLLLWSYRHELEVNTPEDQDSDGTHGE